MLIGNIHSIETFGTVDGPGVRYVVFLQGCPMRCLYCHNPDTWEIGIGKQMTTDEIIEDYNKYKAYLTGGGITCTGGEPLLQMDFIIELFTKAKALGVHTCIDTCGITFNAESPKVLAKFDKLLEVTDLFLLDIKHINNEEHIKLTSQPNLAIIDFARYLSDKKKDVWIRHVVVPGYTYNDKFLYELGYFLGSLKNIKALDVLPYHTMGTVKYETMGLKYPLAGVEALGAEDAKKAREKIFEGLKQRLIDNKIKALAV